MRLCVWGEWRTFQSFSFWGVGLVCFLSLVILSRALASLFSENVETLVGLGCTLNPLLPLTSRLVFLCEN